MAEDKNKNLQEERVLHAEDGMNNDELEPGSAKENKANKVKHGGTAAGTEMLLQMDDEELADEKS